MKNLKLVFLTPVLLLSSCSLLLGPEIKESEAQKIEENIKKNNEETDKKAADIQLTISGAEGKGDEKVSSSSNYRMKSDGDGSIYFYAKEKENGVEEEIEYYTVKDKTYDEVTYVVYFNKELNKKVRETYVKKGNDSYSSTIYDIVGLKILVPTLIMGSLVDPTSCDFEGFATSGKADYSTEVKYHSWGKENLSVEVNAQIKGAVDRDAEEVAEKASLTVTYDKLFLKEVNLTQTSTYGNKSSMKGKISFAKTMAITLPNGWKDVIVN